MGTWMIAALIGYGLAAAVWLAARLKKKQSGGLVFLSAFLAVGTTALSLLLGMGVSQAAAALTGFLLLNMGVKE